MPDPMLETIRRTAALARLALSEEEAAALAPQFTRILEAFRHLEVFTAPADGTPELAPGRTRADEPRPFPASERLAGAAPRPEDGFYAVPKTVGGDA